ncbi:glucosaminidase domain-containing protein [Paenibacillus sinopodophylli]|uniref:glucosaminidase domain-containing protein n=1 Tax=Paenibacillus sinopodophylli TaxID=1837342 RepID=UPI00110CA3B0|nr:glucosaminidase domain-containing protein [Paenibacillus sinopodophylli]
MRKKLSQHLFFYLLILSLVVTLGMYVQPLNNEPEAPATDSPLTVVSLPSAHPVLAATSFHPAPSPTSTPASAPESPQLKATLSLIDQPISSDSKTDSLSEQQPEALPEISEIPLPTYEVTAFYLNIRTEPNAKSEIIKVVKQGTLLTVAAETENGWLQLKDRGYVHGGYAERVKREVTILSSALDNNRQPTNAIVDRGAEIAQQSEHIEEEITIPDLEISEVEELQAPTSLVKSDSGLTVEHISKIFENTALSGHDLEQAILEIEDEYGINAYFTIAVMKLESGNGKSSLAKRKNNLFGLNAIDGDKYNKAFSFETKSDSVRKFGQLLSKNYVGKGLTTIEKVARKYCPANSKWSSLVKNIMKSDYRKL